MDIAHRDAKALVSKPCAISPLHLQLLYLPGTACGTCANLNERANEMMVEAPTSSNERGPMQGAGRVEMRVVRRVTEEPRQCKFPSAD